MTNNRRKRERNLGKRSWCSCFNLLRQSNFIRQIYAACGKPVPAYAQQKCGLLWATLRQPPSKSVRVRRFGRPIGLSAARCRRLRLKTQPLRLTPQNSIQHGPQRSIANGCTTCSYISQKSAVPSTELCISFSNGMATAWPLSIRPNLAVVCVGWDVQAIDGDTRRLNQDRV